MDNNKIMGWPFTLLGWFFWAWLVFVGLSVVVLVVYGIGITVVALDRGESWAEYLSAVVFVVAFLLVFRELR